MKAIILYIVAIIAILAGCYYSYHFKDEFQKTRDERVGLDEKNGQRSASIKERKGEVKEAIVERDKAYSRKSDANAELSNTNDKLSKAKKEVGAWKNRIAEQAEKIERNKKLIKEIKAAFAELGPNVTIEQVPALIAQLDKEATDLKDKTKELSTLIVSADKKLNKSIEEAGDLDDRLVKRAKRMKGNSAEGRVTAVNHDWGFAVLQIPSDMPVSDAAKLMVKRGTSYVGDLKINAIEGSRIVADIDYSTMKSGLVVQPGDKVILTKPVTN